MPDQTAASVVAALNKLERRFGKKFSQIFKSITFDNGSEFMDCAGIEKSVYDKDRKRTKVYYCHPYSAYERGTNENINKMDTAVLTERNGLPESNRRIYSARRNVDQQLPARDFRL